MREQVRRKGRGNEKRKKRKKTSWIERERTTLTQDTHTDRLPHRMARLRTTDRRRKMEGR